MDRNIKPCTGAILLPQFCSSTTRCEKNYTRDDLENMMTTQQPVLPLRSGFLYIAMPLLLLALGYFPERALLKDFLSTVTILAFCLLTGQFFWTSSNTYIATPERLKKIRHLHITTGYACISIVFLHPFLLIVPHYYGNGATPTDALATILTTFTSKGIVLGIIAWLLLVTLGLTSLLRRKLPVRYATWRKMHELGAILFIITATWHAVDLGRHTSIAMSTLFIILASCGALMYFTQNSYPTFQDQKTEVR